MAIHIYGERKKSGFLIVSVIHGYNFLVYKVKCTLKSTQILSGELNKLM